MNEAQEGTESRKKRNKKAVFLSIPKRFYSKDNGLGKQIIKKSASLGGFNSILEWHIAVVVNIVHVTTKCFIGRWQIFGQEWRILHIHF